MKRGGPMKRSALKRGKGPKTVSDRRQEKRDRSGARGPLCDEAKQRACAACGNRPSDPAHLERVGKGYGD